MLWERLRQEQLEDEGASPFLAFGQFNPGIFFGQMKCRSGRMWRKGQRFEIVGVQWACGPGTVAQANGF